MQVTLSGSYSRGFIASPRMYGIAQLKEKNKAKENQEGKEPVTEKRHRVWEIAYKF